MKKQFLFAVAVTMLTACVNTDNLRDISLYQGSENDGQIGFSTFTSNQTKAENSSATAKYALYPHQSTFEVWGSKYIGSTQSIVFDAQKVTYNSSDGTWDYTPIRFWDKSATKYDFYAAAPYGIGWVWDNTNKALSLASFEVDGESLEVTNAVSASADMPNDKDIMISTDITNHHVYIDDATTTTVDESSVKLEFNHILSRINIGVMKAASLSSFEVRLKNITVYNMKKNGKFTENPTGLTASALQAGTIARWSDVESPNTPITYDFNYTPTTPAASPYLEITDAYKYVYQGLIIPQEVAYHPTVLVNDYDGTADPAQFKLDGSNKTDVNDPYLSISYEIWTPEVEEVLYTAEDPEAIATPALVGTPKIEHADAAIVDSYVYFYNLADMFNGPTGTTDIKFCEGWQNTLNITINPTKITFEAKVFEWVEKFDTDGIEVDVD